MKTLLKVISIIYIVGAAILLIAGIVITATGTYVGTAAETAGLGGLGMLLGIIMIIACIPSLLVGIFGLKGCGGSSGLLMAGIVLTIIGLVFTVFGIIYSLATSSFTASSIGGLILPILYLIGGFGTRKELM
ncbi:MAG: hypothetical protein VB031_00750 [Eubacteriaceae bacterium]|nr:hypothetical protein [Eubacteriaceae bacterium]